MGPKEFAESLRRVAAGIDRSKNPDRGKVADALKGILSSMAEEPAPAPAAPSDIASELRAIAEGLDNSKKPDRAKVAAAIKGVLGKLG